MNYSIEMNFRPVTYWPESLTPQQAMSRIKGHVRRQMAQQIYEESGFAALNEFLVRESLDKQTRRGWGSVHPAMLGGEFLPDLLPGEVEIVRISLRSVTSDQISVRARPENDGIRYRVVGEYEDDGMNYTLPFDFSGQPLSLAELMQFLDGSYIDDEAVGRGVFQSGWQAMLDSSTDPEEIVDFQEVSSPFYPDIGVLYQLLGYAWCDEHLEVEEDEFADDDAGSL